MHPVLVTFIVLFGLLGATILLLAAGYCIWKWERSHRLSEMSSLAKELGMLLDPDNRTPDELGLPILDLYRDAGPCNVSNILKHESESRSIWIFDVFCSGYYGRDNIQTVTIIAIQTSTVRIPDFSLIYKDGYLDRVDGGENIKGLEFEHCWNLTSLYLLRSDDPAAVSALLTDRFIKAFGALQKCNIEHHSGWLFVYRPQSRGSTARREIVQRVERGFTFANELEKIDIF